PIYTIAVVSAGAMGSAIAKLLIHADCTIYTNLDARSPAAHQRALDAGMVNVSLEILLSKSNLILNIVPPGEAFPFMRRVLAVSYSAPLPLPRMFVDCNAVNPETVKCIGGLFKEAPIGFIDAGIAGTPLREGWDPTFDACTESGLKSAGAGIGDASSLKLCESVSRPFLQHG
ncbi:hypothetical protein F4604DRAFT_1820752, partial [Suillus subluteus]